MTGKHAHAITYRLLADMIHSIYLSISTMLISKYHGIPILSVSLYGHSTFLSLPLLLSARFKMQSCPAKYNNPSLYLPCPTLYFCYFSMSAVDFWRIFIGCPAGLNSKSHFSCLAPSTLFLSFHFFTGVTAIVHCLILQVFFSFDPPTNSPTLLKQGKPGNVK